MAEFLLRLDREHARGVGFRSAGENRIGGPARLCGRALGGAGRRRDRRRRGRDGADTRAGEARVVGDDRVDAARGSGVDVGGRVERVGDDLTAERVRLRDVGGGDRPGRRDPLVAAGGGERRARVVELAQGEERGRSAVEVRVVLEDVEVRGPEALHDQPRGRQAGLTDRRGDSRGEAVGEVEIGVRRLILDLDIDLGAGLSCEAQDAREWRHARTTLVLRAELARVALSAEQVEDALRTNHLEGLRVDATVARRGPVEGGVVDDDGDLVGGQLDVELEYESARRRVAEGGHRVLRVLRHLLPADGRERAAAVGVDVGGGGGELDG